MSYTLSLGNQAPSFSLPATDGKTYELHDFDQVKGLVIFFTCNHCPYVKHSNEYTRNLAESYQKKGIQFLAINSNSPNTYSEDSFENMKKLMKEKQFPWRYLFDATQQTALAYGALKTPHFYLFNEKRQLIYTGRALDNPKSPEESTHFDLQNALDAFLEQKTNPTPVTNPIGCNIKWEGKPPKWMPPEACDLIPL